MINSYNRAAILPQPTAAPTFPTEQPSVASSITAATKDPNDMRRSTPCYLRRSSANMKHGRTVPEAAELFWVDRHFDGQEEDLVAVFDLKDERLRLHRHKFYWILLLFLGVFLGAGWAIQTRDVSKEKSDGIYLCFGVGVLLLGLFGLVYAIGRHRITVSTLTSIHLAVVKDGIKVSQEEHLGKNQPLLAGIFCFDSFIRVDGKEETVRTPC